MLRIPRGRHRSLSFRRPCRRHFRRWFIRTTDDCFPQKRTNSEIGRRRSLKATAARIRP